jgi:hypothetical protein
MVMLYRFVPWGVREPTFHVAEPTTRAPLSRTALVLRSTLIGLGATAASVACALALDAIRAHRAGRDLEWLAAAGRIVVPASAGDVTTLVAVVVVGVLTGLAAAAGLVARRSARTPDPGMPPPAVP